MSKPITCTSTHCERRQECASPRECTGDGKRRDPIIAAMTWLQECSDWMLSTDLDMQCPMKTDPLEIVEDLAALREDAEKDTNRASAPFHMESAAEGFKRLVAKARGEA